MTPTTLQFLELSHYDPDWIPLPHETRKRLRGRTGHTQTLQAQSGLMQPKQGNSHD